MGEPAEPSPPGGRLSVVGTPIGNLEDISRRAVRVLGEADVIFCEDTRRTRKLLSALGVPAPRLARLDAHTEAAGTESVLAALERGAHVVLVSDAGMPTVSDPGTRVVAAVAESGQPVEVVPGPSAVSAALAISGLPAGSYRFAGFLPRKGRDRAAALAELSATVVTVVVYEAANRVVSTVADLAGACGPDRAFVAARELTKLHEEVWRGTLGAAVDWLASSAEPRGEWVLLVGARPREEQPARDGPELTALVSDALQARIDRGSDRKQAVAEVAAALSVPKRMVYDVAVNLKAGR